MSADFVVCINMSCYPSCLPKKGNGRAPTGFIVGCTQTYSLCKQGQVKCFMLSWIFSLVVIALGHTSSYCCKHLFRPVCMVWWRQLSNYKVQNNYFLTQEVNYITVEQNYGFSKVTTAFKKVTGFNLDVPSLSDEIDSDETIIVLRKLGEVIHEQFVRVAHNVVDNMFLSSPSISCPLSLRCSTGHTSWMTRWQPVLVSLPQHQARAQWCSAWGKLKSERQCYWCVFLWCASIS